MTYFGFTIGPVVRTLLQARKTRELWAASFVFSYFMKNLLLGLKPYGDIVAPDTGLLNTGKKLHGAGIWPDRCFVAVKTAEQAEALKKALPDVVENALKPVDSFLPKGQIEALKKYFHCYACCFNTENDGFEPKGSKEHNLRDTHLFRLNKMLDDLELTPKFEANPAFNLLEQLDENIQQMYPEGFEPKDTALREWNFMGNPEKRVRSLPEIALQEFSDQDVYRDEVVLKIEDGIRNFRKNKGRDEEEAEEKIYQTLKGRLGDELRARHRYIAIVHADGDRIGNTIQSLQNDPAKIKDFSKELMAFSTEAVGLIHDFGAMPVYAGGDDLLFIAPLQNKSADTVYHLLHNLREAFMRRPLFQHNGASLSFGISISYYKYPLAEALQHSYDALKFHAKTLCINGEEKKDAQAVHFLTHSGHQFKTVLWQAGDAYKNWLLLFKKSEALEEAFLNGLMHKLDDLALWLYDACHRNTLHAFFKAHFNEAVHSEKWKFIEAVQELTQCLYAEGAYARLAEQAPVSIPEWKEWITAKKQLSMDLKAMLRLVQFQNAPDHD